MHFPFHLCGTFCSIFRKETWSHECNQSRTLWNWGKKLKNDSQKSAANLIYLFDFIRKKCQITEKHHNK